MGLQEALENVDLSVPTNIESTNLISAIQYLDSLTKNDAVLAKLESYLYHSFATVLSRYSEEDMNLTLAELAKILYNNDRFSISRLLSVDGIQYLAKMIESSTTDKFKTILSEVSFILEINYTNTVKEQRDNVVELANKINDDEFSIYYQSLINKDYLMIILFIKLCFKQNFKYCIRALIVSSSVLDNQ